MEERCITMHQPWASLLVYGIKRIEGRAWPTDHRGRLWIHAASKIPEKSTIEAMENFYRDIYELEGIENVCFPSSYPTSVLLGCVDVIECSRMENIATWDALPTSLHNKSITGIVIYALKAIEKRFYLFPAEIQCSIELRRSRNIVGYARIHVEQRLIMPREMRGQKDIYSLSKELSNSLFPALIPVAPVSQFTLSLPVPKFPSRPHTDPLSPPLPPHLRASIEKAKACQSFKPRIRSNNLPVRTVFPVPSIPPSPSSGILGGNISHLSTLFIPLGNSHLSTPSGSLGMENSYLSTPFTPLGIEYSQNSHLSTLVKPLGIEYPQNSQLSTLIRPSGMENSYPSTPFPPLEMEYPQNSHLSMLIRPSGMENSYPSTPFIPLEMENSQNSHFSTPVRPLEMESSYPSTPFAPLEIEYSPNSHVSIPFRPLELEYSQNSPSSIPFTPSGNSSLNASAPTFAPNPSTVDILTMFKNVLPPERPKNPEENSILEQKEDLNLGKEVNLSQKNDDINVVILGNEGLSLGKQEISQNSDDLNEGFLENEDVNSGFLGKKEDFPSLGGPKKCFVPRELSLEGAWRTGKLHMSQNQ